MTTPVAEQPLVDLSVHARVATITTDSPANRNALSRRLRRELREALTAATDDPSVGAVVLTHRGPVFCSGMDLEESQDASAEDQGVGELPELLQMIVACPVPVVARVHGPARAGGIGLMAVCDLVVASEEATFAFSEVHLGVIPAVISLVVTPRIGRRAARELFLTGEVVSAQRAHEVGLVDRVAGADTIDSAVGDLLVLLLRGGPTALAATKTLLRRPVDDPSDEDYREMQELSARFFSSAEASEGMAARREKRLPEWVPAPAQEGATR